MQNCSFIYKLPATPGLLVLVICLLLMGSCEPKKLPNGKAIADEMERHLVKRITGAMIAQETQRVGDSLIRTADQQMLIYLKNTLDSGKFKAALQYRQLTNYAPVTDMAKKYQASLGRTGKNWTSPTTNPVNLLLQEQLKKYQALNRQNKTLRPEVIRVGQTDLLYTKPILMTDARCLHCHGEPAKTLSEPQQKALPVGFTAQHTSYQSGDWAGMWYVRFKAKGILDGITQKRKKSRRGQPLFSQKDSVK